MNWLTLTLASVIISSFANILQKVLMRNNKSDPTSYATMFHIVIGIFFTAIAFLTGFTLPPFNQNLIFFIIAAILWGLGTVFLFNALKVLESSEVTILSSFRSIVTIAVSVLFLGDLFNLQKIIGTVAVLSSAIVVSNMKRGLKFNKGVFFSLGMAVSYGLAVFFDALILKTYQEPLSYLAVGNILIAIFLLLLRPKTFKEMGMLTNSAFLKKIIPLGVFSTVQATSYYYALASGPSSQIAAINQSGVIFTVLFAYIFLKERDLVSRKVVAAAMVLVGISLLR